MCILYTLEQKVSVLKVNPTYTSLTCSCCGHVSKLNRVNGSEMFSCVECGHEENADINAAKNILVKGLQRGAYSPSIKNDIYI